MKKLLALLALLLIGCLLIAVMLWLGWRKLDVVSESRTDPSLSPHSAAARLSQTSVVESADWLGKTGLGMHTERELVRYLRHQFDERQLGEHALHAGDLQYVGMFNRGGLPTYFWRIQLKRFQGRIVYAYLVVNEGNVLMGWGDRRPPASSK